MGTAALGCGAGRKFRAALGEWRLFFAEVCRRTRRPPLHEGEELAAEIRKYCMPDLIVLVVAGSASDGWATKAFSRAETEFPFDFHDDRDVVVESKSAI